MPDKNDREWAALRKAENDYQARRPMPSREEFERLLSEYESSVYAEGFANGHDPMNTTRAGEKRRVARTLFIRAVLGDT